MPDVEKVKTKLSQGLGAFLAAAEGVLSDAEIDDCLVEFFEGLAVVPEAYEAFVRDCLMPPPANEALKNAAQAYKDLKDKRGDLYRRLADN